ASLPIEVDHIAHRRDGRGLHPAMYQLHVIDIVGGAARLLSTEEADVSTPMWSPDGTTIAARVGSHPIEPSELVLYNEEGLRRSVIPAGWTCTSVCWHGSGNSLVFAGQSRARYSRHQQLFTVTLDGARPRRLAS